jgi:DNA modification methylase
LLKKVKEPFADLVFADPPFNIGYAYDRYKDDLKAEHYVEWTRAWMTECVRILKPHGSFYVAIGDDYAADVRQIGKEKDLGLTLRNWIIGYYTFGQQTRMKFARSHTHIFYFVKDAKQFTFNDEAARVISDRQKIYKDRRANPLGKLPDDVWFEFPRVCGTFEERTGWHPCQMPENLLARIIRVSSNPNDWILDPFSGSGTTCVTAHKLKRNYTGFDISPEYVDASKNRLQESEGQPVEGEAPPKWTSHSDTELKWLYHESNIPSEQLQQNRELLLLFTNKFNHRVGTKTPFAPEDLQRRLVTLRKSGKLGPLKHKIGLFQINREGE